MVFILAGLLSRQAKDLNEQRNGFPLLRYEDSTGGTAVLQQVRPNCLCCEGVTGSRLLLKMVVM